MWDGWRRKLRWRWQRKSEVDHALAALADKHHVFGREVDANVLTNMHDVVHVIRQQTHTKNRNNLTRTKAYLDMYQRHPELHWALLAHLVSRNGGYSMTDLKGEWFIRLNETTAPTHIFSFLEHANWLIFDDAYPQLLLYEEGKRRQRNLSNLLKQFGISKFMKPIWDEFWLSRNSALLTHGLIVNEQNVIERPVIQNETYRRHVLNTVEFSAQSLLGLNQVVLPYDVNDAVHLSGITVRHFASVDARIRIGRSLYQSLFPGGSPLPGVLPFVMAVNHSASRADYWPHKFTANKSKFEARSPYRPVFSTAKPGNLGARAQTSSSHPRVYSPRLDEAFADVQHKRVELDDWFEDASMALYLRADAHPAPSDFERDYLDSARLVEQAIESKQTVRRARNWVQ